jgi:hypothetical protein
MSIDREKQKTTEEAKKHVLRHRKRIDDGLRGLEKVPRDVKIQPVLLESKTWNGEWISIEAQKETTRGISLFLGYET